MAEQLSTDTIAIVASNLTAAFFATGVRKVTEDTAHETVLHVFIEFAAALEEREHERGVL